MDFSNHDLVVQFDVQDSETVISTVASFLSIHSADPRIVLASCKDSLLQALGTLTCHKSGIQALERAPRKRYVYTKITFIPCQIRNNFRCISNVFHEVINDPTKSQKLG